MRRRRTHRSLGPAAVLVALVTATPVANGDGGALVARGELDNGEPAAVFVSPVPPRVGLVAIEAASASWRATPPRILLERNGLVLGGASAPSPSDPLAAFIEIEVPAEGMWRLVVESDAGRLEADVPIAAQPPPWRSRLPWMLAWIPATLLLWARARLVRGRNALSA
ncbi:MAG: hypothetical protein ACO3YY_03430 [Phycisphaerales bacterium]|jgi:hypothetical protein